MSAGSKNKKNRGIHSNTRKTSLEKRIEKLKKPGRTYTKAQLLALKRKASNDGKGKTIAQVKAENEAAMRKRAKAKYEAFKENRKLKIKTKKEEKKKNKKNEKKNNNSYENLKLWSL